MKAGSGGGELEAAGEANSAVLLDDLDPLAGFELHFVLILW